MNSEKLITILRSNSASNVVIKIGDQLLPINAAEVYLENGNLILSDVEVSVNFIDLKFERK